MHRTLKQAFKFQRRTRHVLGATYLIAGIAKCFPVIESTPKRLAQALRANQGHPEENLTRWLAEHAEEANTVVAVAMTGAGCILIKDDGHYADAALAMTLPMLFGFILVLRRVVPQVIPVDLIFGGAAIYVLIVRRRCARADEDR